MPVFASTWETIVLIAVGLFYVGVLIFLASIGGKRVAAISTVA